MTDVVDLAGWTLLHFLWQGALIGALAAGGLHLLRAASARARYALACGALAAMLAAPLVTVWRLASAAAPARSAATLDTGIAAPVALVAPASAAAADGRQVTRDTSSDRATSAIGAGLMPLVVALWLSGVAVLLARLAGGCWRIRAIRRVAAHEPSSRFQSVADAIARRLRLARPVFAIDSAAVDTPTVVGWLRPIVLLPAAAMANLTPGQVEAIIAHELAHIRRHDFAMNLLQAVAETLLFYHPAVWWLSGRIRTEREHCCDDVAVDVCGDAVAYATALTELAAWSVSRPRLAMAATEGPLLSRVRRLLNAQDDAPRPSGSLLALGLALVLLVAGGSLRAISIAQTPEPEAIDSDGRFGPRDLNRMLGFELFPGPVQWPTDDPIAARAWGVTIESGDTTMQLLGFSARSLVRHAYSDFDTPIVDVPEWLDQESFDVTIPALSSPDGGGDQGPMSQAIRRYLEEELGLVTHRETRELPVYALVRARDDGALGPNLKPSTSDCVESAANAALRDTGVPVQRIVNEFCGLDDSLIGLSGAKVSMAQFSAFMRRKPIAPDRIVVDRTGLDGPFDFTLRLGFLPLAAIGHAHPTLGTLMSPFGIRSFEDALEQQLGLKLVPATARFEVIVVDEIRRPS